MKKIFALLVLLCGNLFAAQIAPNPDFQTTFDKLQGFPSARKYLLGTLVREAHNTAICVYDYPTQGGTVFPGTVVQVGLLAQDLKTPCLLPGRAVIRGGMIDVSVSLVSVSATLAISTGGSAGDLRPDTGYGTFNGTGELAVSPALATVTGYIKLPLPNTVVNGVNLNRYQPYLQIKNSNLTAGHFRVFIDYVLGE